MQKNLTLSQLVWTEKNALKETKEKTKEKLMHYLDKKQNVKFKFQLVVLDIQGT